MPNEDAGFLHRFRRGAVAAGILNRISRFALLWSGWDGPATLCH